MHTTTTGGYTSRALNAVAGVVCVVASGLASASHAQVVPVDVAPSPPSQAAQYDATTRTEAERADARRSAAVNSSRAVRSRE